MIDADQLNFMRFEIERRDEWARALNLIHRFTTSINLEDLVRRIVVDFHDVAKELYTLPYNGQAPDVQQKSKKRLEELGYKLNRLTLACEKALEIRR